MPPLLSLTVSAARTFVTVCLLTGGAWLLVAILAGSNLHVVQSPSMIPSLAPGDIIAATADSSPEKGDILVVRWTGRATTVTHRLVDTIDIPEGRMLITKGDANRSRDIPVSVEQVEGRFWLRVPYLGWPQTLWASGRHGLALFIVAAAVVLLSTGRGRAPDAFRSRPPPDRPSQTRM